MKHQDFFVRFYEEKGGLDLFFGSPSKDYTRIRSLIYFLSDEKDIPGFNLLDFFRGIMKKEANLLQKHIDKFEVCFGSEFPKYEEGLRLAEQRYFERMSPKR